jgi:hypothetical protein
VKYYYILSILAVVGRDLINESGLLAVAATSFRSFFNRIWVSKAGLAFAKRTPLVPAKPDRRELEHFLQR